MCWLEYADLEGVIVCVCVCVCVCACVCVWVGVGGWVGGCFVAMLLLLFTNTDLLVETNHKCPNSVSCSLHMCMCSYKCPWSVSPVQYNVLWWACAVGP